MMKDVFSASGECMGTGDIPRRHLEKIAYHAPPKRPRSDLFGAEGSCPSGMRH